MNKPHDIEYSLEGINQYPLPAWLEESRLPDDWLAKAYENLSPQFRAAIKTGIALADSFYQTPVSSIKKRVENSHAGFWVESHAMPAKWAAIIFDKCYSAAARLSAGALLPILAGVEHVFSICAGEPRYMEILPALEICGVEDIFSLDIPEISRLLEELAGKTPTAGRLMLLHDGNLYKLAEKARELDLQFYEEINPPALLLPNPSFFNKPLLTYSQGFLPPVSVQNSLIDAIYTTEDMVNCPEARLILTPGLECFWLHKNLEKEFFLINQYSFGLL